MNENNFITAKEIVPSLKIPRKKGDNGIVAVVSGHRGYVGATYFAANSAMRVGADMVYIITSKEAEDVKIFSPDFIVHPIINDEKFIENECELWLGKADVVVIGTVLGRERKYFHLFEGIIDVCKKLKKGLVIDCSGLIHLSRNLNLIKDYPEPGIILTPNGEEFKLLFGESQEDYSKVIGNLGQTITVFRKGVKDEAINCTGSVKFPEGGSYRRCTGQGDFLAGVTGAFLGFAIKYALVKNVVHSDFAIAVCEGASKLVRECNSRAFAKKGRAMLTSDMIEEISGAFKDLFEED